MFHTINKGDETIPISDWIGELLVEFRKKFHPKRLHPQKIHNNKIFI